MGRSARKERKVVSVVFVDLVGFTARAESLDPEDVQAILEPYHARVREELERHGGTVEKFIGDAVMAVFGAPAVREDDAERAVRAALAICDWAREQEEVEVRIAVNTGEALVSIDARPEAGEALVAGDVVNTASRLQSAAPVNGVLVGETTYRATERAIEYREAEAVEAKGKAAPVPVWEAVQARALFGVDVDMRPVTPLVGRRRELDQLLDALARARAEREPQLVTIVGVPGMGKSRLVQELSQAIEADPDLIRWRQGRSLPYGTGVSFWALGEMVKAEAGILETDSAELAGPKLRAVVERVCADSDAQWVETQLRPLVGIADEAASGSDRRDEAFAGWRRFLEGLADERSSVLVFEDLHWADDGLLDFVDALVDWATDVPLLVIGTARPELLARRPGWGGGKPNSATLSLAPLSEDETAEVVHAILERAVLPAEIQTAVLARAGGNPLYAEEFARMVADRQLRPTEDELPVPESVQGLIAARLDGLGRDEKALLQDAAVVGKVFWPGALAREGRTAAGLDEALRALERREFVRRERRSSVEGEQQYVFRHVLVRDVAYGQIPRAERGDKHVQVADWIESLPRTEDAAELLAHHYLSALDYARAAGRDVSVALGERASAALREAGHRALTLNAFASAYRFYEAAAELMPRDHPAWLELVLEHAVAGQYVDLANDHLLLEFRDALLAGDPELAARGEILLGEFHWLRGQRAEANVHFRLAEELGDELGESETKVQVLANLSRFAMLADENERAVSLGRRALAMAESLGLDALRAHTLNNVGVARVHLGDHGGVEDIEESRRLARERSMTEFIRAGGNLASTLVELGELTRARELHEEALAAAQEVGQYEPVRWLTTELAFDRFYAGDWDEALVLIEGLLPGFDESPFWIEPEARVCAARLYFPRGAVAEARGQIERAVERARASQNLQELASPLGFAARLHAELGELDSAREVADELLERWTETAMQGSTGDWLVELWLAAARTGREDALSAALGPALQTPWVRAATALIERNFAGAAEILREIGSRPDEALVRLWAAEWLLEQGRRAEADAELERSLAFWRSVGATRYLRQGDALLAAAS